MDFTLSESEQAVLDTARDFAQTRVRPIARELDQTSRWLYLMKKKKEALVECFEMPQ